MLAPPVAPNLSILTAILKEHPPPRLTPTPLPFNERSACFASALNLPPLSKGGGLTARHKLLFCCSLLAICPPFLYCKLFCRQDGGIATPLPHPAHPIQNRTIPPTFRMASVCVCLYGFAFALSLSLFVGEWACPSRCTVVIGFLSVFNLLSIED